jgi:hypothetical protein
MKTQKPKTLKTVKPLSENVKRQIVEMEKTKSIDNKKSKDFQKIYLYRNEDGIKSIVENAKAGAKALNDFIISAQTVTGLTFDNLEREQLKADGVNFIKATIRKHYKFPLASDPFNNEILGFQNIETIYNDFERLNHRWTNNVLEIENNGLYVFPENEEAKIVEYYTTYTTNQKQKDVLEQLTEAVTALNILVASNVIDIYSRQHITKLTPLIRQTIGTEFFSINLHRLTEIRL